MRRARLAIAAAAFALALITGADASAASPNVYNVTKLVSDQAGVALHQDTTLVNAWGLTALAGSPWWVADNGADASTLYMADGTKVILPGGVQQVAVHFAPTGAVANDSGAGFVVSTPSASGSSRFIFSTEDGTILGWSPAVSVASAIVAVPNTDGAVYKGLALAANQLYATDFHNGKVDVFDSSFHSVTTSGGFVDSQIPRGYAPFGIQNVGGDLVVTYAKQDADAHDDVAGQGHGFVDLFDTNGNLIRRIAQHGQLNSPWGIAMAPASFGAFGGDLLIGNFGDGDINAFAQQPNGNFEHAGELRTADHKILSIDGLWSLQFGRGSLMNNGPTTTLFFTAGPDGESHGLFGTITAG
jgi:uncharacterized protein (TIGR03118 family)